MKCIYYHSLMNKKSKLTNFHAFWSVDAVKNKFYNIKVTFLSSAYKNCVLYLLNKVKISKINSQQRNNIPPGIGIKRFNC